MHSQSKYLGCEVLGTVTPWYAFDIPRVLNGYGTVTGPLYISIIKISTTEGKATEKMGFSGTGGNTMTQRQYKEPML